MDGVWGSVLIAVLLLPVAARAAAPVPVLIVHSYNLQYPWTKRRPYNEAYARTFAAFLRGAPVSSLAPVFDSPNHYQRDVGELKRRGLNPPPGFLDRHRERLWLAVYLLSGALFLMMLGSLFLTVRKNRELRRRARRIESQAVALRASEESYRGLFDSIRETLYIQDEHGIFLDVNAGAERMYGYTRAEMRGMSPEAVAAPGMNDLEAIAAHFRAAWAGTPRHFEFWGRRKDGGCFPKDVSLTKGSYFGREVIIAVAVDVSDRQRAEAESRVAAIAFESQEAIIITDAEKVIQRVNPAFTKVTGYSAAEAIGRTPAMLQSGRQDAAYYRAMWEAVRTRGEWQGEIWNRRKSGEIYPEWLTITAVKDATGTVVNYVGMFQDITERKSAEERIRNLAFYDALTQLPNRRLLLDRLHQALANSHRGRHHGALLFIDLAMYQAKASGRNTIRFFDPTMQASVEVCPSLEAALRRAIPRGEFILHYQPQVAANGDITGMEALARWRHPELGLVLPHVFIALAEETGLIIPIGQQILEQACAQLKRWSQRADSAHLSVSVNVSARQFHHPDFIDMVETTLDAYEIDASGLVLEITESLLLENVDETVVRMNSLRARGLRFSIDDFGTGYPPWPT